MKVDIRYKAILFAVNFQSKIEPNRLFQPFAVGYSLRA